MAKQPTAKTEDDTEDKPQSYQRKTPRNLIVMGAVFIVLVVLVLGGLLTALFSHSEDPAALKVPAHVARSLDQDQPAEVMNEDDINAPQIEEQAPVIKGLEDVAPAPQSEIPTPPPPADADQTETTIQLGPQSDAGHTIPVLIPKKEIAPQSMIQWPQHHAVGLAKTAQIVIVIDDMGLNHRNSQRIAAITAPLTLAYLPYAEHLPQQTEQASKQGHELIVHMPMQPQQMKQNNPGPNALLTDLPATENLARMDKNLSRFNGYIGLNNHMGSDITANEKAMRPIMADIKRRGLWFLDSRTIGGSVAGKLADEMNIPYVSRDVFLDNAANVSAILGQLRQVEHIAQTRGYAVAIGHPYDATIAALTQWLPQARAHGVEIVPLSTVISERFPLAPVPRYARTKNHTSLSENAIKPVADRAL